MKKLNLDALKVDTFATTDAITTVRGTVNGREMMMRTMSNCPESWNGTCWITCWDSCGCDTDIC